MTDMRVIVETTLENLRTHKAVRGRRYEFTTEQAAEVARQALERLDGFSYPANFMLIDAVENILLDLLKPYRTEVGAYKP